MDYDNLALKEMLLRVGTVRRKIMLQKLKKKLEEHGLTQQEVYNGLVQLVLRPRVHLTRSIIAETLHLRSHASTEIVECEDESSSDETIQENTAEVEPEKVPTPIAAVEASKESEKLPTPIAAVKASKEPEKVSTPIAVIEASKESEKLPTPITAVKASKESEKLPTPIAAIEACNESKKLPTPIAAIEVCNKSEKLPTPIAAIESCNKSENLPTPIAAIESCNKSENLPNPIAAIETCNKSKKLPTPIAACDKSEKLPTPIAACNKSEKLPTPIAACDKSEKLPTPIGACNKLEKLPTPIAACNKLEKLPTPIAGCNKLDKLPTPIAACNKSEKLPTPIAASKKSEKSPTPIGAVEVCKKSEKLPIPIAAVEAYNKLEKSPTPIAAVEAWKKSEQSRIPIAVIEACKKSEKLPIPIADPAESKPCEKPDVSSSSESTIPELLAESVGNRIPAFIAKKPRKSIALNLKRPRIIEDVTIIGGSIFNRSSFSNISNRFMEPSPAKKSKCEEVIIEEKEEEISNLFTESSPAKKSKFEEAIIKEKEEEISNLFTESSPGKKSKCEEVIIKAKEEEISSLFTESSPAKTSKCEKAIIEEKEEEISNLFTESSSAKKSKCEETIIEEKEISNLFIESSPAKKTKSEEMIIEEKKEEISNLFTESSPAKKTKSEEMIIEEKEEEISNLFTESSPAKKTKSEEMIIEEKEEEISNLFTESSPAKKSKCEELIIEEKKEEISNPFKSKCEEATIEEKEEEDEEEEEELVTIMANAVEGKRENTNIEATKRCRLRKKLRQIFGKTVTLSEIEEEDQLMNESIPKKRRKESRMSLDSGVSLSEVISERVTTSPDEFHEKIADKIEELPVEEEQLNNIELAEKICNFDPLVRSMPLLDSSSPQKNNDVIPEANLAKNPEINLENYGGKFKILITPFDSNGADTFAPMSLEFDLESGSHVSTTQFVAEENSALKKKRNESYDLSTLLEISPQKNCLANQLENTISILGENGKRVTTNIIVSTENNAEIKSILADNFSSNSHTKCQLKNDDFDQKTISSATKMCVKDKIVHCENTEQKMTSSVIKMGLKDQIFDSQDLQQKSGFADTEMLKNKIKGSEVLSDTEMVKKVMESKDSNQRKIFSNTETLNPNNWDQIRSNSTNLSEKTASSSAEKCNNEILLNPTKCNQETISSAAEKCLKGYDLNSTFTDSKPKDSDQRSLKMAANDINGKPPSQSVNSVPEIEKIVIKEEIPEVVVKTEFPAIVNDEERQNNGEKTQEVQQQLINEEKTPEVQGEQINVEKTPTNEEGNKNSSNSMPKLRLLHHSELGSRWCPTPMNGSVSSTSENNSAQNPPQIQPAIAIQSTNSSELLYPDNQLQYLPFLLGNVVPVIINQTPNLGANSAQNCYNIPEKRPIYPTPGNFVSQRPTTAKKVLLSPKTNLPSNSTSNVQKSNSYVNIATNSYNNQGIYVPSNHFLAQGTIINKEMASNVNGNFPSTITSNTHIFYNNTPQNIYNNPANQATQFSMGYSVPNATTNNQKKDQTPAQTNCSAITINTNLCSKEAPNGHNLVQKSSAVPIDYSVAQGTANNQKTPSTVNILGLSTITTNTQSLVSKETQNGQNIQQKEQTNVSHDYSIAQGITNNQKGTLSVNTNFSTSNTQIIENGANISQQQQKNVAQGTNSSQISNLQNSSVEYTLDTVFKKIHKCVAALQNSINLSYLAETVDQRAELQKGFVEKKNEWFVELVRYCFLLNMDNVNVALQYFVERYEEAMEVDKRQFDLKEVLYIFQLEKLPIAYPGVQITLGPPVASATTSARRGPYVKKNSTSRVAENKKRLAAANASAVEQSGTEHSRTPPTYVNIAPQPGTSNSRTPPMYVTVVPQPGTGNSRTPPTFASGVPQPGISNSRTPPAYVTVVPQPGTGNSRTPPTSDSEVPQPGTSNSRTPPAYVTVVPQPGTGKSRTPPEFPSGVPQPGTGNSRTSPEFPSGVPQPGTGNSRTSPEFPSGVPQPGTGNSRTPPTFTSGVPQPGTGNSRTSPEFVSGVPQPGTNARTPPTFISGVPQPGTGNLRTPPEFPSGVPQPGTGNLRTPPEFPSGVPQPGTGNSRTPPTYVNVVPQNGTGNSRTPPTFISGVPQPGTGNSRTPPEFPSGVPQPGTGNLRTPPEFPSGVPQPGTGNSRTSPTYVNVVPQNGTGNSRTPPTFISGVPQPGTGNSRTPPTYASGVPQPGTSTSRTLPAFSSGVPQPGTSTSRTLPAFATIVPQPGTGNSRTPPEFASRVPQPGTGNSRTPPEFASRVPQPGTGNSRTSPMFTSGVPQPGTGNSRTSPEFASRVPQPGTGNSRTSPMFASGVPQPGTTSTFTSGVPQPGTANSRTSPEFASRVPQPGTGNSRTPPEFASRVPQPGTGNSRTSPMFASRVPQPGTGNSRTSPMFASGVPQPGTTSTFASGVPQPGTTSTFASGVPQPGTSSSRTLPTFASGVPQSGTTNPRTTSTFTSAVPHAQFPRPHPPPGADRSRWFPNFPETEHLGQFVYSPAAQERLNTQIESCNFLIKKSYIQLCAIKANDPTYRYIDAYHLAYRQAMTRSIQEEEFRRRRHHELRQISQQQILASQRRISSNSTFVPPQIDNSRLPHPNSTRGPIFAGNLENIRNMVDNFDPNRKIAAKIAVQNPANCSNQARIPLPVEMHQSTQNSDHNLKDHMDNVIESTLRNCLTTDNNNTTILQNPGNNSLNVAAPLENISPGLQIRPVVPFQPNTPQEAINNRNAQLEKRLNSAKNQQNEPEEFSGSRNQRTAILTNKTQRQNFGTSGQESATQEPTNSDNLNGIQDKSQENAAIRKANRKNRKNETPATNDEQTVKEPEEVNNNAQWEVRTSPLKTSDQQGNQTLKVRLKRVNIPANHDSHKQNELQQNSVATDQRVLVSVGNSGHQLELQTNFVPEVQQIVAQESVCRNSENVDVSANKIQSEKPQSLENVRDDNSIILASNNSNLAVNLTAERSELPQNSAEQNAKSNQENNSVLPGNNSTQPEENVAVNLIKDRAELGQNPVENQEAIRTKSSSLPSNDSAPNAKQINEDLAAVLPTEEPQQNSAIDDEASSNKSKNIEKLSSNGCNVKVVDVLEEFDALSSNKKAKKANSTDPQSSESPQKKSLPLHYTTMVPIDLIEEKTDLIEEKTENQESEEEDNDFTLYQSEDESPASASQISVITINDDDDDDDFNLQWVEESKTNEEVTLPQNAEVEEEEEIEIKEIASPEKAETAEEETNEIREIASPEKAETAEKETNEIGEIALLENTETAEKEDNEISEITSPEKAETEANEIEVTSPEVVEVEEETVDKNSCEIVAEEPEEIHDEPMEIFSILDVKSISKDAYNNMGETGDIEPEVSSIKESNEADNLGFKDDSLPNCSRCGKSSSVVCEQCFSAFYCSAECHYTHWAEIHHLSCKPVPEEARELMP